MAGRRLQIAGETEDTPEGLREQYRRQGRGEVRTRLHALWLLRSGWGMEQVAEVVGVHYRTVQRWVGWYRQGGIAEVRARHGGGHGQPAGSLQNKKQQWPRKRPKEPSLRQWMSGIGWPRSLGSPIDPRESMDYCVGCAAAPKSPAPSMLRQTWRPRKAGKRGLRRSWARGRSNLWGAPGLDR